MSREKMKREKRRVDGTLRNTLNIHSSHVFSAILPYRPAFNTIRQRTVALTFSSTAKVIAAKATIDKH